MLTHSLCHEVSVFHGVIVLGHVGKENIGREAESFAHYLIP